MLKRWVLAREEVLAREFDQHKFLLTEQTATPAAEWSRLAYVSQANLTTANDFYALPSVPVDQQGHELRFSLPFPVAHAENATAMAEYFPSKRLKRAVIIEPRLRAFVGYLSGADFPRVVWQGSATQHIVRALGSGMNQEFLARVWACINPENYLSLLGQHRPRMHIGAARYDTICEAAVTKQMLASLRAQKIPHRVHWYGCGHNTLALFPFRQLAGLRGILFMRGL